MKTAEEIVDLMTEEMPFEINPNIVPYIIEAMKVYANQKIDLAAQNLPEGKGSTNAEYIKQLNYITSLKDKI